MQQRQRLKNLDRFVSSSSGVLLCTDVAARGLDVPTVPLVIHYQLPLNAETYIHRCGRTARAGMKGLCVAFISEQDKKTWQRILTVCHHGDMTAVARYVVDEGLMRAARARVGIARQMDLLLNAQRQSNAKRDWFVKHAEEMDMLIDADYVEMSEEKIAKKGHDQEGDADNKSKLRSLQARLDAEMRQSLQDTKKRGNFFTLNIVEQLEANKSSAVAKNRAKLLETKAETKQIVAKIKSENNPVKIKIVAQSKSKREEKKSSSSSSPIVSSSGSVSVVAQTAQVVAVSFPTRKIKVIGKAS